MNVRTFEIINILLRKYHTSCKQIAWVWLDLVFNCTSTWGGSTLYTLPL